MAYTLPRGKRAPVVSQQDQENAARAREAAAAHSARTGPRPLDGGAAASPAVLDPQTQAMMQQLLANPGAIPGRNVNADTVASATPGQLAGELAGRQDYLKLQPIMAQEIERQEAERRRVAEVGVMNSVLGGGGAGAGMGAGGGAGAGVGRPVTLPQVGAAPLPLPSPAPGLPMAPGGAASAVAAPDRNLGIAAAAGPNISTTPFLPAGSIGYERPGGAYVVEGAPGSLPLVLGSEREAQRYFAGSTSPVDAAANRPSLPSPQIDPGLAAMMQAGLGGMGGQSAALHDPALQQLVAQGAAAGMPRTPGLEYARGMLAEGFLPDPRRLEELGGLTPKPAEVEPGFAPESPTGKLLADADQLQRQGRTAEADQLRARAKEGAPSLYASPKEQADAVTFKSMAEDQEVTKKAGAESAAARRGVRRAIELLEAGSRTGFGADAETKVKQIAASLGIESKGLATMEELQANLGDRLMDRIGQTKGSISDYESRLFSRISASSSKTPEGNLKILRAYDQALQRREEASRIIQRGRREKRGVDEIDQELYDFMLKAGDQEPDGAEQAAPSPASIASVVSTLGAARPAAANVPKLSRGAASTSPAAPASTGGGRFKIVKIEEGK